MISKKKQSAVHEIVSTQRFLILTMLGDTLLILSIKFYSRSHQILILKFFTPPGLLTQQQKYLKNSELKLVFTDE